MTATPLLPVREDEQQRALDVLVLAFAADPVERWLYPEARQYLTHFSEFLAAFGGKAFTHETVWQLGEFSAVAIWLPPRVEVDGSAIVAVLTETVAPAKHEDTFSMLSRWMTHTRDSRIGTCHRSALTGPCRAGASAAN